MAIAEREKSLLVPSDEFDIHRDTSFHRKMRELDIVKDGERVPLLLPPISHPGSMASYFLEEYRIGNDLAYAYVLHKGHKTSRHYHLVEYNVGEDYYWVAGGEQKLLLAGVEYYLNAGNQHVFVPPGAVHQSFSNSDVLTFVRMRNGLLVPKDKRHIQVPETTWEMV